MDLSGGRSPSRRDWQAWRDVKGYAWRCHADTSEKRPERITPIVALSTVETDIQRGAWVDPAGGKITIAALAARWLESDPSKRFNTKVRDEMAIRLHIVPAMGTCELGQVTPRQVQGLINTWADQRAPGSVRRDYAVLRAMFGYAVESDWLVRSPCRRIKLPAVELPTRPQLSPDDVVDLADAVGIREAPIIWIGALLGLRWGEVAGLRVGDVDLLRGTIRVAEQRPAHGPPGPPKSRAGLRALTLPAGLVDLLAAHYAAKGLSAVKPDSLVFTSHDGSPLNYANWRNRVWLPAVKRAGIKGIGFHDLRRTNATQFPVRRRRQDGSNAPRTCRSARDPGRLRPGRQPGRPGRRRASRRALLRIAHGSRTPPIRVTATPPPASP